MFISSKKTKRGGFTIIEMLVSVFIFTVSLAALMYMSSRGLQSARQSQHKVTAEFLAVEGIEVVRNIRDKAFIAGSVSAWANVFKGPDFFDPDAGCYDNAQPCEFNLNISGSDDFWYLQKCDNDCKLYLDATNDIYEYSGSTSELSPYIRKIFINEISDKEVEVNVVVSWNGGSVSYTNNMFLWKKN